MAEDPRQSLAPLLLRPESPEKTAALAAWFQGLYRGRKETPVLVGGAAVEIYTDGAYTTGDLDFVGELPPAVARGLEAAGFSQRGRHWVHESGQVFLELPGAQLGPAERAVHMRVAEWDLLVLSPEDTIVDRLAAWQFWKSPNDGIAAFQIWKNTAMRLDQDRLAVASAERRVTSALESLQSFAERLAGREPDLEELERWAQTTF